MAEIIIKPPFTEEKIKPLGLKTGDKFVVLSQLSPNDKAIMRDRKEAVRVLTEARERILASPLGQKLRWDPTSVKIDDVTGVMRTTFDVVDNPIPLLVVFVVLGAIAVFAALRELRIITTSAGGSLFLPAVILISLIVGFVVVRQYLPKPKGSSA